MHARLLLVRHGQSTWNAAGRWQGRADPPLSELGTRQARHAAGTVGAFDQIVSSTLARAQQTATIIAETLGIGPITTDPNLVERHAGAFEGRTRDEIEERWPGWLAEGRRPDDYESTESVVERAVDALGRIAAEVGDGGTALVVTHGGVIGALEHVAGVQRDGRLPNLAGRWFDVGPGVFRATDLVLLVEAEEMTVPRQL